MPGNRANSRNQSTKAAFCGMMVALSVVLMLSGGLIPVATYCVPLFCGILLLPILLEYGNKTALTAFAATAFLALLLGSDKEAAFFYLFLGHYPILKWQIDRLKPKAFRLFIKLLVFNLSVLIMYLFLGFVLNMDALVAEFTQMGALLLAGFIAVFNLSMFVYDRLLFPLVFLYANRIKPKLHL